MRRSPAFTISAILTLALGVGASTAIFTVVDGVLLRPLPYRDPDALVMVNAVPDAAEGRGPNLRRFAVPELQDWIERSRAFESLALYGDAVLAVRGETGLETVFGSFISERFFETLGQPLAIGRPPGDPRAAEAVISDRFWQRRFSRDPEVLGREIQLNGRMFAVVGVTRPDFEFPTANADIWTPLAFAPSRLNIADRRSRYLVMVSRLKPGVTLEEARRDARRVADSLATDYPGSNRGFSASVVSLREQLTGHVRNALLLLGTAVGLLLSIACANLATLLLVRHLSRSREIAIRLALGASRARLIGESLIEAVIVALGAAFAGTFIAATVVAMLAKMPSNPLALLPEQVTLPRLNVIGIDAAALMFAAGAALVATLIAAIGPVLHATRRDVVHDGSLTGSAHTATPVARRVRSALVVGQLAISVILLVGAGLLARSFIQLLRTDLGVTPERVVTIEVNVAMGRTVPRDRQVALAADVVARIERLPGVSAAGVSSMFPVRGIRTVFSFIPAGQRTEEPFPLINPTPGYFRAVGVPLLKGRLFTDRDTASSPPVMILSATAARYFFGATDPLGQHLPYIGAPTIVGVVGDVKYGGLTDAPREILYRPFSQFPIPNFFVAARTPGNPTALAADLRRAVHAVDPEIMAGAVRTLDDMVSETLNQPRFRTVTLLAIAALALGLAAIGLYGLISYAVVQRTREIGIRIALGADRSDVVALVLRQSARLTGIGLGLGLAGAAGLTRFLAGMLFGLQPFDPVTLAAVSGLFAAVATAAAYLPARRATKVDPLIALRCE